MMYGYYSEMSDSELWSLFLSGDKKALSYIYKNQYHQLLSYGIKLYPDYEVAFLTGSDNLKTLDTWKKVEELTTKFKLYILERDNDCMEEIIQNNELLKKHRQAFIKAKDTIKSNLSSTFVREKIKNGKSIRYLTPDEVITYIKEHQLYQ